MGERKRANASALVNMSIKGQGEELKGNVVVSCLSVDDFGALSFYLFDYFSEHMT